jgi:NitT/TauT family transport system substrate-binding protein
MSEKTTGISLGFDPTIENPKSKIQNRDGWSRREFLSTAALAGTGALLGLPSEPSAAEPPPETTRIRLDQGDSICTVPKYLAEELLTGEGFTDIQYVKTTGGGSTPRAMATGAIDISATSVLGTIAQIEAGEPIVFLGGLHIGCYELFGNDRIRSIRDLKGKRVAVTTIGSSRQLLLASMASYVGLDPRKDIEWVTDPPAVAMKLFAEGKVDAFMGFPPEPQELRTKKIGHVVVDITRDRPWSQYFCCVIAGNREFTRKHPVATKRVLRAILKGVQICAVEPERAARLLVNKGSTKQYDYALQSLKEIPYARWREYDPEDTVRFYSLRLHEAGLIKSSPQKIISQGTDWRFLRELKKELKA